MGFFLNIVIVIAGLGYLLFVGLLLIKKLEGVTGIADKGTCDVVICGESDIAAGFEARLHAENIPCVRMLEMPQIIDKRMENIHYAHATDRNCRSQQLDCRGGRWS